MTYYLQINFQLNTSNSNPYEFSLFITVSILFGNVTYPCMYANQTSLVLGGSNNCLVSVISVLQSLKIIVSSNNGRRVWWTMSAGAARCGAAAAALRACSRHAASPACSPAPLSTFFLSQQELPPADKQPAKACARAVLPHSVPLGASRLVRSPRSVRRFISFSCSPVAVAIIRHCSVPSHYEPANQQHINLPK